VAPRRDYQAAVAAGDIFLHRAQLSKIDLQRLAAIGIPEALIQGAPVSVVGLAE
jgi:hypothetical protein